MFTVSFFFIAPLKDHCFNCMQELKSRVEMLCDGETVWFYHGILDRTDDLAIQAIGLVEPGTPICVDADVVVGTVVYSKDYVTNEALALDMTEEFIDPMIGDFHEAHSSLVVVSNGVMFSSEDVQAFLNEPEPGGECKYDIYLQPSRCSDGFIQTIMVHIFGLEEDYADELVQQAADEPTVFVTTSPVRYELAKKILKEAGISYRTNIK
jgi:hypothetical protein